MKYKKIYKRMFIFTNILLFTAFSLLAQSGHGRGRIAGAVVDENQKGIPQVKIVCEFKDNTEFKKQTFTNKKGEWSILGLGTGIWKITVSKEGYISSVTETYIKQLERNPKIVLTLKKIKDGVSDVNLDLIGEANAYFKEKQFDKALSTLQQFLKENQDSYQTYIYIGDCYREMEEFDLAIQNYQKILEHSEIYQDTEKEFISSALTGIGECYLKMEDLEKAQSYFEQSLKVNPENEGIAYNVGEIYFFQKKIDQAIKYFTIATQIKPKWSAPYLKLGYVNLNKGDYESAEMNFKKFLELDPNSPEAPSVKNLLNFLAKKKY